MRLSSAILSVASVADIHARSGENAFDLAFTLMALQNQFELDEFEELKQKILVALIVACPAEVAPCV